jgi:hypothetical protein
MIETVATSGPRVGAHLRVFRGGAGTALGGASHDPRRGAAHRRQHRQAAGFGATPLNAHHCVALAR